MAHLFRRSDAVVLALLYPAAAGCSTPAPPEPLVPVAGLVTLDGRPLAGGNLVFAADAARGNPGRYQPSAVIGPGGRYEVNCLPNRRGIPPGWYKVLAFATDGPDVLAADGSMYVPGRALVPPAYHEAATTPLAVEARADAPPGAYDLALTSRPTP